MRKGLGQFAEGANIRAKVADDRSNNNEQYCRNYNIRIYNLIEPENETPEECEEAVLKLFKEKLCLINIVSKDLDAVHRLGKKKKKNSDDNSDGGPRAVIVRFVSRRTRNEVISKRRLLKKKNGQTTRAVTIAEDLTKTNYIR